MEMNNDNLQSFIRTHAQDIDSTFSRGLANNRIATHLLECIDGRDPREGMVALPGAGIGLLMCVRASLRQHYKGKHDALDAMLDDHCNSLMETGFGNHVTWHTDCHQGENCTGCGHIDAIFNDPAHYGLESQDIAWFRSLMGQTQKVDEQSDGEKMNDGTCLTSSHINYEGPHAEQVAVIIEGKTMRTFAHDDVAFAFNLNVMPALMRCVAKDIGIEDETFVDLLIDTMVKHTLITSGKLTTNKGNPLPLYYWNVDEDRVYQKSEGEMIPAFNEGEYIR